jgi:hypothetical protein
LPVTWILWPTCFSRSLLLPVRCHVELAADAVLPGAVEAVVLPVVPAVVAPAVPDVPVVGLVVVADALPAGSMRALLSTKLPSAPLARQKKTLMSLLRSLDIGRCGVAVGDGVVVGLCAPTDTAKPSNAATHVPVAVRFMVSASLIFLTRCE